MRIDGAAPPSTRPQDAHVAVLMAVRNGERFLRSQIATLAAQDVRRIDLWISDDGSNDATREIIREVAREWTRGEVTLLDGPRMGFAENYRALMTRRDIAAEYYAFCDQDDLWEPRKLSVAIEWLASVRPDHPALYCSRTRTIAEDGAPLGFSPLFPRPPSFRNALVQSIAGGNTMVMNNSARTLMAIASRRSDFVSHDWWCYQMVTGAGGSVHYSRESHIGYRQHGGNLVGENNSWRARMFRVRFMFRGRLRQWNDQNMLALRACSDLLTPDARETMEHFSRARSSGLAGRIAALVRSGVYRQTLFGQIGLVVACALRKL